ncbi:MAG: hypothetical protein KDA22_04715 [Phycisphaerales bacterium]|nr:hypothetical protein [Phycisphaerales bacterium]
MSLIPPWDALHPLVVHFPIALLIVAPLFVVAALVWRRGSSWLLIAALAIMVLGTIGALLAVSTGESAGELAERTPAVAAVLEEHEELAETTRNVFLGLTALFAAVVVASHVLPRRWGSRMRPGVLPALQIVFLALYGGGVVLLVNAAHQGGRLVHEFGVTAMLSPSAQPGPPPIERTAAHGDDD